MPDRPDLELVPPAGVADHLSWTRRVLDKLELPKATQEKLRSKSWAVQERLLDPELRIAVIGETSSGKSTLINAFLRRRLLPSSALVTTRTNMTLRHGHGSEGLSLRTADGRVLTWPSRQFLEYAQLTGADRNDLRTALRSVLVTERADHLSRLDVWCPTRVLGDQVTVIDTPGFSVDEAGHRSLAAAAIGVADLVIVVLPAVAATSLTAMSFLQETTRRHRHRCVFVLTKADLVEPAELGEVVATTRSRLADAGFANPLVLACAPELALRALPAGPPHPAERGGPIAERSGYLAGRGGPAGERGHLVEFEAMEARLATLAARRRAQAIAATVYDLLTDLLRAVEGSARSRREHLTAAQRGLQRLSLPDLPGFLERWRASRADQAALDVRAAVIRGRAAWQADLNASVAEAVAGDRINDVKKAAADVSSAVQQHFQAEINLLVGTAVQAAGQALGGAADALAAEFGRQFTALSTLAGSARPVSLPTAGLAAGNLPAPNLAPVFGQVAALAAELSSTNNWRTGGGIAAGALIGTAVLPGLGTIVGSAIGGLVARRGADSTRAQFLARAMPIVEAAGVEVRAGIGRAVEEVIAALHARLADIVQRYRRRWGAEIERLTRAEAAKRAQLAAGIEAATAAAAQARARIDQVAALRGSTQPDPRDTDGEEP